MLTTLEIDDDILSTAEEIAKKQGISTGKVISELARQALTPEATPTMRNGVPIFPLLPNASVVTLELVNQLRDELP